MPPAIAISQAASDADLDALRELIREYTSWAFSLTAGSEAAPTFHGLDAELAALPGPYAPPDGRLLLARADGAPAGCVAMRRHDAATAELKRLYVRPACRGLGIAQRLVATVMDEARREGYPRMRLDSHVEMKGAHAIYRSFGFHAVPTPADFPEAMKPIAVFMECDLGPRP
jgi:GNAT superfamily N-acetyltransferase